MKTGCPLVLCVGLMVLAAPSVRAQEVIEAGRPGCPERRVTALTARIVNIFNDDGRTVDHLEGPGKLSTPIPILKCVNSNVFMIYWNGKPFFVYRVQVKADVEFKITCDTLSAKSEPSVMAGGPEIVEGCRKATVNGAH